MSTLARRVVTALVLLPVFLGALFLLPPTAFALFLGVLLLLGAWEWAGLCKLDVPGTALWLILIATLAAGLHVADVLFATTVAGVAFWVLATIAVIRYPRGAGFWQRRPLRLASGLLVLLPGWAALTTLQATAGVGPWLVLWTMLMVWSTDTGAYFAGRAFGRRKLAPAVSPGKTVEGLVGGALAALIVSVAMASVGGLSPMLMPVVVGVTAVVVASSVVGDLLESLIKRVAGVKDSGTLLPGHGGVLDRVDATLAAAPVAAVLLALAGPSLGL